MCVDSNGEYQVHVTHQVNTCVPPRACELHVRHVHLLACWLRVNRDSLIVGLTRIHKCIEEREEGSERGRAERERRDIFNDT